MEEFRVLAPLFPEGIFLVGGAVRDTLLGGNPKDLDFSVPVPPEEILSRVRAAGFSAVPTGMEHGTVTVLLPNGKAVEVTAFRREIEHDGRRARVVFGSSLEEDLARRDFTVNAMAIGPDGSLVDPFGGLQDLRAGLLRAVGDPAVRFREDYLRVVRLARFAARFGWRVDPATWHAARRAAPEVLRFVSLPRLGQELDRGMAAPRPGAFLRLLFELGLLYHVFPELQGPHGAAHELLQDPRYHPEGDVLSHLCNVADRAAEISPDPMARWGGFLHDIGKPACAVPDPRGFFRFPGHDVRGAEQVVGIARRLGFSNAWMAGMQAVCRLHMRVLARPTERAVRRFQAEAGTHLPLLEAVCRADGEGRREDLEEWFRPRGEALQPRVRGRDLIAAGLPPGPHIGIGLRAAWEAQLAGQDDRAALLEIALQAARNAMARGSPGSPCQ